MIPKIVMKTDMDGKPLRTIRWRRATRDFCESHDGQWWITPVYGGMSRPERYQLNRKVNGTWKVVESGQTQGECKDLAEGLLP